MSGYGVLPGFAVAGLEHTGDLLTAMNWQGRRLDPTGFYDMGARFYDPEGRKFLSPDPLGHASSMDLYNYANGDPINHIDPDGRLARMIGGAISATFEFLGGMGDAAREMSEFAGGTAVDFFFKGRMPNGSGPSAESVEIFNQIMVGVQIAAIPLSFIGGPVGIIAMGVGSFASLTQGDLGGAVMGMAGGIGRMGTFAVRTAGATVRAEAGLMSAGGVGRNFAGTASKPWGAAASRSLGTLDSGGTTTLNYSFKAAKTPAASMSDLDFVRKIAKKAESTGIRLGYGGSGTGPAQGTWKHNYARRVLERYQRTTGQKADLIPESSYLGGSPAPYGAAGSARPDVFNLASGELFDYKFVRNPGLGLRLRQRAKNVANVPGVTSQHEINP